MSRQNEQQNTRWLLAAMAAPVTQAASSCSWLVALSVGFLCLGISFGLDALSIGEEKSKLLSGIQWLWMLLIVSEFLHWTMLCWPNYRNYHAVPLTILVLAALSLAKGSANAASVGSILLYMLIFLLGAVLFSGIKEIKLENMGFQWEMQTAYYVVAMMVPVMASGTVKTTRKHSILVYAVAVALITCGVLSPERVGKMNAPFYEMSRSISLLGVGQRFESLVAAGMTLGYFALISFLLNISSNMWDPGKMKRSIWISACFTGLVFLSGMRMNSRLLALGTIAVWVILPILEKIVKIMKIPLDKRQKRW